ncbi:N-6 DNA methylase [Thermopolyspora sp. NPDC052614]|uniref:N-6 DNA methylase n=1 Tax=Thermopolyspora sp. NPDC052614 TaxID=3155682 RepID=UPI0034458B8D
MPTNLLFWQDEEVSPKSEQLTAAEISRLAGVTRATVSNWRRRHADFPQPSGGSAASPTYDRKAVESWLAARGQLPKPSLHQELLDQLRKLSDDATPERLAALFLAVRRTDEAERRRLSELPDEDLLPHIRAAIGDLIPDPVKPTQPRLTSYMALMARTLLLSLKDRDVREVLDVFQSARWPDASSARAGHDTPEDVADLMAALVERRPYPASVFDPACGSGELLVAAGRRGAAKLFGQDLSSTQADMARFRVGVLVPEAGVRLRTGDSLRQDAFPELTAEAVLCNPPYADRGWGQDELGYDTRWMYGVPNKKEPEFAWVQHCLAHLEPDGQAVILLPPSVAERPGGRKIRAELVRRNVLQAIIALPPGAAPPPHVGLHLWILRRPSAARPDTPRVLFIDTAKPSVITFGTGSGKSTAWVAALRKTIEGEEPRYSLRTELRDVILKDWRSFQDAPEDFVTASGIARAVPALDLLDESVDLTPSRHVRAAPPAAEPQSYAEDTRATRLQLRRALDLLSAASGGEDWKAVGARAASWRTATVADLVRGGAIGLHRAKVPSREKQATDPDDAVQQADARVLTAGDVITDQPASGRLPESPIAEPLRIQRGDVLLPEILHDGSGTARVAEDRDVDTVLGPNLYLFRPDLNRIDSWFLAGFLSAEENLNSTATGSTIVRVDARRLRVPLLPLEEQRRYGRAFRRMAALRRSATLTARLAAETARQYTAGLTSGVLLPPDD